MIVADPPGVHIDGNLMLAAFPTGNRSSGPVRGWLKWAGASPLTVERSILAVDVGDDQKSYADAFDLASGTLIEPASFLSLTEFRCRTAIPNTWTLNDTTLQVPDGFAAQPLTVIWLPLTLSRSGDPQFVVSIANATSHPFNLPELIWNSALIVGGQSCPFAEPGLWNGRAVVEPGGEATLQLSARHFGIEAPHGARVMRFRCGDFSSPPVNVNWR